MRLTYELTVRVSVDADDHAARARIARKLRSLVKLYPRHRLNDEAVIDAVDVSLTLDKP